MKTASFSPSKLFTALPKPNTFRHLYTMARTFSSSMDSSINKLTIITSTPLLKDDRSDSVSETCQTFMNAQMFINASHWLVQAATLLEITTPLVH